MKTRWPSEKITQLRSDLADLYVETGIEEFRLARIRLSDVPEYDEEDPADEQHRDRDSTNFKHDEVVS